LRWAVVAASVVVGVLFGCAKKSGQEAVPDKVDTLPIITYDTLTDERDGKTYKTVNIGGHVWMAENLNYETDSGSWCDENCDKYGRLYDYYAGKNACPVGWHVSSDGEWQDLIETAGGRDVAGKNLKAKSEWKDDDMDGNGIDRYGFSALPVRKDGTYGSWWADCYCNASKGTAEVMYYNFPTVIGHAVIIGDKSAVSVRCVKDND